MRLQVLWHPVACLTATEFLTKGFLPHAPSFPSSVDHSLVSHCRWTRERVNVGPKDLALPLTGGKTGINTGMDSWFCPVSSMIRRGTSWDAKRGRELRWERQITDSKGNTEYLWSPYKVAWKLLVCSPEEETCQKLPSIGKARWVASFPAWTCGSGLNLLGSAVSQFHVVIIIFQPSSSWNNTVSFKLLPSHLNYVLHIASHDSWPGQTLV